MFWIRFNYLIGSLFMFFSWAVQAETSLTFNSETDDYIGQGVNQTWTETQGNFTATKNADNGVTVNFAGTGGWITDRWTLEFAAPGDALLEVGTYPTATLSSSRLPTAAGLDVKGAERSCQSLTGQFDVLDIVYGFDTEITRFAAVFIQYCNDQTAALHGYVLFSSDATVTINPLPETSSPTASSPGDLGSLDASFDPGSGVEGAVYALMVTGDDTLFVGGDFTTLNGQNRPYLGKLNSRGQLDIAFNPSFSSDSTIYTIVQDQSTLLVGGRFTEVMGQPYRHLVRMTLTGALDSSLDVNIFEPEGYVRNLLLHEDRRIILTGDFKTVVGGGHDIVRLLPSGNVDIQADMIPGFYQGDTPDNGIPSKTHALASGDFNVYYISGDFDAYDNSTIEYKELPNIVSLISKIGFLDTVFNRNLGSTSSLVNDIATINGTEENALMGTDSQLISTNTGGHSSVLASTNGRINTVLALENGQILIAGNFTTVSGHAAAHIARLTGGGSVDDTFVADVNGEILNMVVQADGQIIIGGLFTEVDGVPRKGLARLNHDIRAVDSPVASSGGDNTDTGTCGEGTGSQGEWLVPTDCTTIQAAINAANDADTVLVSPGTYMENLYFKGKNITVKSVAGAATTVINGNRPINGDQLEKPVVSFTQGETRAAVLDGFTLLNGESSEGGGISIKSASPTIRNNIITRNYCRGSGNGIYISSGSPLIENNTINNNHNGEGVSGGGGGGGIAIFAQGQTEIIGNRITNNTTDSFTSGGGIYLFAAGNPLIQNNYIASNRAIEGGGIALVNTGTERLIQNLIVNNVVTGANGKGGGVHLLSGADIVLLNNTIADNSKEISNASAEGLQLYVAGGSLNLQLQNNIIQASQGAVYCETSDAQFANNNISGYSGACSDHSGNNGNISQASLFAGGSEAEAYRLKQGSPELDAGQNGFSGLPDTDFLGHTRISDDNGDGQAVVDMGAFEGISIDTLSITVIGNGSGDVVVPAGLGTGIQCGTQCTETYVTGSQLSLTATAANDSEFIGWAGDCAGSNSSLSLDMNKTLQCYALFNQPDPEPAADIFSLSPPDTLLLINKLYTFTLNWSRGEAAMQRQLLNLSADNGTITPALLITDAQGEARFTMSSAVSGQDTLRFSNLDGSVEQSIKLSYVTSMDAVASLNVQIIGSGQGLISSSVIGFQGDGIHCGVNCSESYNRNISVSMTATPVNATDLFLGWGGDCSGTTPSLLVLMSAHKHCTAEFEAVIGAQIETIAGVNNSGFAGDGGSALSAQFSVPAGLAIDSNGVLYITDAANNRIRKMDTQGVVSTVAGHGERDFSGDDGAAVDATLNFPSDVAVDSNGVLYIADTGNHRVRRVGTDGVISTIAGTGIAGFGGDNGPALEAALNRPSGLAVDTEGRLYIADTRNHRLRMVNTDGVISTVAGTGLLGFSGDGAAATLAMLNNPAAVALDQLGLIYLVDKGNHRVRVIDTQGAIFTLAGNGQAGFSGDAGLAVDAQLDNPQAVIVDNSGQVYISDSFNHRIRRVVNGVINTVAGNGQSGYSGDGLPGLLAQLNQPWGLAVNAQGQVVLSDVGNHVLRRLDTREGDNVSAPVNPGTDPTNPGTDPGIPNTALLSVHTSGSGSGMISAVAGQGTGIRCGELCSDSYTLNTVVTLTATPDVNSDFSAWSGDCQGSTAIISLTLDSAKDCIASFTRQSNALSQIVRIQLSGSGSGSVSADPGMGAGIDCGTVCEESYVTNSSVQLRASAANDSEFIGWRGDCGGVLTPLNIGLEQSRLCEAVFDLIDTRAPTIITTVAGNGTPGSEGNAGQATAASLKFPTGVMLDQNGRLLIVDSLNNQIRQVEQNLISTLVGSGVSGFSGDGGLATQAQLASPTAMAIAGDGSQYIADTSNHRVRKIDSNGQISTVVGIGTPGGLGDNGEALSAQLHLPYDVAVDAQNQLYIADSNNHRIRRVDSSGRISTFAGTGEAGFSGDGDFAALAQLDFPTGVAVTPTGELLISDSGNHRIRRIDRNGHISTLAGSGAGGLQQGSFAGDRGLAIQARLNNPRGLAVDALGQVYVTDSGNHRIRKIDTQGIINTVAGTGSAGFSGDGSIPTQAMLNNPIDVWLDAQSQLYIADSGNHRIRRVAAAHPYISVSKLGKGSGSITSEAGLEDGIDCGDNCGETYLSGASVVLQAIPDNGSVVFGWQGCTPQTNDSSVVHLTVQGDRSCAAQFDRDGSGSLPACPTSGQIDTPCYAQGLLLTDVSLTATAEVHTGTLSGTIDNQGTLFDVQLAAGSIVNGGQLSGLIFAEPDTSPVLNNLTVKRNSRLNNVVLGNNVILEAGVTLEPWRYQSKDTVASDPNTHPDFTSQWRTLPSPCTDLPQPITLDAREQIYADGQSLLAAINSIPSILSFVQEAPYGYLQQDNATQRVLLRPYSVRHHNGGTGSYVLDGSSQQAQFITPNGLEVQAHPALQGLCDFYTFLQNNGLNGLSVDGQGNLRVPMNSQMWVQVRPNAELERVAGLSPGFNSAPDNEGLELITWNQADSNGDVYRQVLYPTAFDLDAIKARAGSILNFTDKGEMLFDDGQNITRWRFDYVTLSGSNTTGDFVVEPGQQPGDIVVVYPGGQHQLLQWLPPSP